MAEVGLYAILSGGIFCMCVAGLIWVPFGALIAGHSARHRGRSWLVSSLSSTLMSVCMFFPWVFALRSELGHPPGPRMLRVVYGFVYGAWIIGLILPLLTVLVILTVLLSLSVARVEPYHETMSDEAVLGLLWVMLISSFALIVMCTGTLYWSLRNFRSELDALRQRQNHRDDLTTGYLFRFGEFEIVTLLPVICLVVWYVVLPLVYLTFFGLAFGIGTVTSTT